MSKNNKLYRVSLKIKLINDFEENIVSINVVGYTHAISEKKAITNVKHAKGIKKRNHYTEDIPCTSSMYVYDFIAEEVENECEKTKE